MEKWTDFVAVFNPDQFFIKGHLCTTSAGNLRTPVFWKIDYRKVGIYGDIINDHFGVDVDVSCVNDGTESFYFDEKYLDVDLEKNDYL